LFSINVTLYLCFPVDEGKTMNLRSRLTGIATGDQGLFVAREDFYTYWSEMRGNPSESVYGNNFVSDPGFEVARGEWISVECMMKLNTPPDERDGEQAFWINGELHRMDGQIVSHLGPGFPRGSWTWDTWTPDPDGEPFDGFRWRTTEDLAINYLWLSLYITGAPDGYESKVWLDHAVVAEEYIGPLAPAGGDN
ncbi:MAG: hypothetical protein R6W89_07990, partial [Candidatus Hydrogenedentota bacterium]